MRTGCFFKRFLSCLVVCSLLATLTVVPAQGAPKASESLVSLARRITPHLKARDGAITLMYGGQIDALFDNLSKLMPEAVGMDDYLRFNLDSWRIAASGYPGDVTVNLEVRYLTTAQDEARLNERLAEELPAILSGATDDLSRIRAINRAISDRLAYDEALREYSAVSGWLDGLTVCQGYALLTHRMCEMAGIPSRILTGTLDGGAHAWNLVRVDGQWLHLDVTNNDASRSDRYFLVADDVLRDAGFLYNVGLRERLIQEWERAEREPLAPDIIPLPAYGAMTDLFLGPVVISGFGDRFQAERNNGSHLNRTTARLANALPPNGRAPGRNEWIDEKRRYSSRPKWNRFVR